MYTFGLSHVKQWTEYTIPNDNTTILVGISIIMASDFYVIIKYCTVSGKSSSTKCKQDLQLRSQIQGLNSTCLFLDLHNILPSTIWPAFFRGLACSHTMLYNCIKQVSWSTKTTLKCIQHTWTTMLQWAVIRILDLCVDLVSFATLYILERHWILLGIDRYISPCWVLSCSFAQISGSYL